MGVFGMIHEIAADLIVLVAEALRAAIARVEEDSCVFNAAGGDEKHRRFNRDAVPGAGLHHPTRDALPGRGVRFEPNQRRVEVEIEVWL